MTGALERLSVGGGRALGVLLALLAVYVAGIALFDEGILRGGAIGLSGIVVLLTEPLARKREAASAGRKALCWSIDLILLVGFVYCIHLFFVVYEDLWDGVRIFAPFEIAAGAFAVAVVVELTRRTFGPVLALICVLVLVYALLGPDLPWIFRHAGNTIDEALGAVWYSFDGVFGRPSGIVAGIVLVFIVFGALLEGTGAAAILLKVATVATARVRGGTAHSAIVASALFGTISGSTVANVVGTGVFTIPMIKRQGFPNAFAGAVEAAASSGGQFTPPIMAAVVFLMAELIGVPYLTICAAAALPALFYYVSLFATVYTEAVRRGIEPMPVAERQRLTPDDWLQSLRFVAPIAVVVIVLFAGRSPAMAGFWALFSAIATGLLLDLAAFARRRTAAEGDAPTLMRGVVLPYLSSVVRALDRGGRACARLMIAVGAIGIVIAVVNTTGLGLRFASMIATIGGGSLWLALALTMLACLVLGMGLPTLPAYLIIVLVMGPAIAKLGIPELLVHLFVLYYGVLSNVTPPVAVAAYAAAPIAGANPMTTGVQAVRLAIVGFVIPFVLIYNPSLALVVEFAWLPFLWLIVRLPLAIWLVASGLTGFDAARIGTAGRGARVGLGFAVLVTEIWIAGAAFAAGLAIVAHGRLRARRAAPPAAVARRAERLGSD